MSAVRRLALQLLFGERAGEQGEFYNVIGSLVGPTGTNLPVKLVWLRRVDGVFSFITLVPESRSNR